jgi:hypothetical protein
MLIHYSPIAQHSDLVLVLPLWFPFYVPLAYCFLIGMLLGGWPVLTVLTLAAEFCVGVLGLTRGVEAPVAGVAGV